MIKQKIVNVLAFLLPLWLLRPLMPMQFAIYGHFIGDKDLPVSKYYRYPNFVEFDQLITWLTKLGYSFVNLENYLAADNQRKVLLTLDDGFKAIIDQTHPYLIRRSVPYAIFIITDSLSNTDFLIPTLPDVRSNSESMRAFLSIEEIEQLKNDGVHIGFHTRNHKLIDDDCSPLDKSFRSSIQIPDEYCALFSKPLCFAYPYRAPRNYKQYDGYVKMSNGAEYIFDTRGFNNNDGNHIFRVGIDAERSVKGKNWLFYVFKRQLVVAAVRQMRRLVPWRIK
ncbi:MAG: polysaccharide deacetylase family protein [Bacteroidetes bacterium]|nr:polysaccharide deacetylase family protein [Bacteroidota bacterium]